MSRVAIVDYEMGNLFSIQQACRWAGLESYLVARPEALAGATSVILPGVGAFGDAMASLRRSGLDDALRSFAANGRRLVGICLGMQLLFESSSELGNNAGLGLLDGTVERLQARKVPHVGWNRVLAAQPWGQTLLTGLDSGGYQYFVHSYFVRPKDIAAVLATTEYAGEVFCSAVRAGNIYGFQFHPERSGPAGLQIYSNLKELP